MTYFSTNADIRINKKPVSEQNPAYIETIDKNFDAFSRLRVSEPLTLFEVQHQYNTQPLVWNDITANDGSISHLPNESSVLMTVSTSNDSRVCRQTKDYFRYQPGKSQYIAMTGVLGAKKPGVIQRIGHYDDNNGIFFEQDQNNLKAVIRTKISGSQVDSSITQANWNLDKLDGSGNSGININTSLTQLFIIDFQWLGVGRVRFGFNIGGKLIYVHEVLNANVLSTVYISTANLPLRYEILNNTSTTSETSMRQICSTVISEGGFHRIGFPFTASNGATGINVTTRRPIISIRPRSTFNSLTNTSTTTLLEATIVAQNNNAFFEFVFGGTLTSADWSDINTTNSNIEFDVAATSISGGIIFSSGYAATTTTGNRGAGLALKGLLSRLTLSTNDVFTIVCTSLNATATCFGSIDWHELY